MFDPSEVEKRDAIHRLAQRILRGEVDGLELLRRLRSTPADLRAKGLRVLAHSDDPHAGTHWTIHCPENNRAYAASRETDEQALDEIRAQHARDTDNLHHAPACPANHYHGRRAPTGPCNCGAAETPR